MVLRLSVVITSLLFVTSVQAQQNLKWRGSSMWGSGSKYELLFDNFNIQTYQGKISKIDTLTPMKGMSYGVVMGVKVGNDEHAVHLGPGWYIMYQDMNLSIGNDIEIKGAPASFDGKQFIMAVEVNYKDKVLLLRDKDGIPYWVGYRKK